MTNHLSYGGNLHVLRDGIADGSVDLIYPDPPFNSNASYNVLFKGPQGRASAAQIEAFDDTWHWNDSAEEAFGAVVRSANAAATMLRAMRSFLGDNDMMACLAMMAVRLLKLHRVLKPTGSLYLHCEPTASHSLKILLDAVFGATNLRNEIVWKRAHIVNRLLKKPPRPPVFTPEIGKPFLATAPHKHWPGRPARAAPDPPGGRAHGTVGNSTTLGRAWLR